MGSFLPNSGVNYMAYSGRFGGTSCSCPQVAAVAALILSIKSNLTQLQVFDILTTTTDQVGSYVYTNNRSNELGFGRLNACKAVSKTLSLTTSISITGPSTICSSASFTANNVPNGCYVTWSYSDNLILNSSFGNSATFSIAGNGSGWVQANLFSNCASITSSKKLIVVGSPLVPIISGPSILECGSSDYYMVNDHNSTIQWSTSYPLEIIGSSFGYRCIIQTANDYGSSIVYATASNECGSSTNEFQVGVSCSSFLIYPNPASSKLTVTPKPSNTISEKNKKRINSILIVNNYGNVYFIENYGSGVFEATIDVSNLSKGVYILKINEGKDEEVHTVLIE